MLKIARVYHIQVKSHKMTIMHSGLSPTMKIAQLKAETLSALTSDIASDALDEQAIEPPEFDVETVDDFELCRAVKEKGKFTGEFQVLEPKKMLRESGINGWDSVFLQFRDRSTGQLLPITYTLPRMNEEEEAPTVAENNKGKRKASVELDESLLDDI